MADERHYNAWYGLGMLYLRQEKFEFSEHHFRTAFLINPKSSVILSYLGTALHFLKVNLLLYSTWQYKLELQLSFACFVS
jgi:Tfp pilus assembly protein PilF